MRIAFVNTDMNVGGIPKASIPLLRELAKHHEVTLILTNGGGEIISEVPDNVKIKVLISPNFRKQLIYAIMHGRMFSAIKSLVAYKKANNWIDSLYARICLKEKLKDKYDLAIAYFGMNAKCILTTLECVKATKRVAFMHGEHPFKKDELQVMQRYYTRFDRLFSVSNATKQFYDRDFPECKRESDVFYNIMDVEGIKAKATVALCENIQCNRSKIHIVTVGRLSPEKGQLMIPDVAERMLSENYDFVWHIVGGGCDYEKLESLIKDKSLEGRVVLYGNTLNPYPYIRAADIYVQPSYTEGYCLTIIEAAILGLPIVATKVGGTWEHFEDGNTIILCQPTVDSLFFAITHLIKNESARKQLSANVSMRDWSNLSEIHKLENL